ncbi:DUF6013 family protein [Trinickia dinghuensis]|uniref:Uncharacterized protein n=1 Tax=Trinickia dinghuensis TaxID=2291023 RepID=A0A3D8JQF8_9BURK|nr:DUF6013 family protein [Trinickia dinghuensis]RDU95267.1 hypothetical protein DWV00_29750 [Trinickia dinghuensis]
MNMKVRLRPVAVLVSIAACAAGGFALLAQAAPPITVTSKTPADGPIKYTVKVASKTYGNAQDTRTIQSGQTDDYTWKTTPPGGSVSVSDQCPGYGSLSLNANGAVQREMRIRLAPTVAEDGTATVQMSVLASTPNGEKATKVHGKTLQCPSVATLSQVVRFTMPTSGSAKTVSLSDGSQVTISAQR